MIHFDENAICPFYIKAAKNEIHCEGLERRYIQKLRFPDENNKNVFFRIRCATYNYHDCPYCKAQEKRYGE